MKTLLTKKTARALTLGALCAAMAAGTIAPLRGAAPDVRRDATVEAVERVLPSVVNIGTETIVETRDPFEELQRQFWGPYYRKRAPNAQYSLGSGVIIDEAGYVLTNEHVVSRASRIWVKLSDGREFEADRIAGTAKSDVALLKLRSQPTDKFVPVQFAMDDDLLLGETVMALGNPFGLGGSVSRGILSSKNRRQPKENEPLAVADWLQTDAAINPGNSGGPLVNLRGELIGISVAVSSEGQGIGFAIPIKRVTEALSRFFTPEETQSVWFGARIKAGAGAMAVASITPGSPAEKAGLRVGDVVQQINGKTPRGFIDLSKELNSAGTTRDVKLVVRRGGEQKELAVRLVPEKDFFNAALIQQKVGLSLQELTQELAERLGFSYYGGFVVAGVDKDGPAAKANVQRYYVIQGVNDELPQDLVELAKVLYARKKGETVKLNLVVPFQRGGFRGWREASASLQVR